MILFALFPFFTFCYCRNLLVLCDHISTNCVFVLFPFIFLSNLVYYFEMLDTFFLDFRITREIFRNVEMFVIDHTLYINRTEAGLKKTVSKYINISFVKLSDVTDHYWTLMHIINEVCELQQLINNNKSVPYYHITILSKGSKVNTYDMKKQKVNRT